KSSIQSMFRIIFSILIFLLPVFVFSQAESRDTVVAYKKRVLESPEVEFLANYYSQKGDNAAVSGGIGTEELTDFHPTIVVAIPLNADDVLRVDAGISAYSSASSSNVDPFEGRSDADPFQASSGASSKDTWIGVTGSYSHSSDDRNNVWSANLSYATEYDYNSVGFGGSYTRLFNEKNTEFSVKANVFLDQWKIIYPFELRPFADGGGLNDNFFSNNTITGNTQYNPSFTELSSAGRNSYALGFGFSQILSKNLQGSLSLDVVQQSGLLSTPFQRVYFSDVADSFIEKFQLADDIERMPDSRFKVAIGGRLHWYLNERFVVRTYYRYYTDNWGIQSHTASIEVPIKITDKFTVYPSYRYYDQTASDHFAPSDQHLSTSEFYTSDYDLSGFKANQYGFGISYTDIFTNIHIQKWGLKNVDLKFHIYDRNTSFQAVNLSLGLKFVRQ
ncbi:MAG: hypothetical protein ACI8VT_002185, partial [Saprospiraceae bacterium]